MCNCRAPIYAYLLTGSSRGTRRVKPFKNRWSTGHENTLCGNDKLRARKRRVPTRRKPYGARLPTEQVEPTVHKTLKRGLGAIVVCPTLNR